MTEIEEITVLARQDPPVAIERGKALIASHSARSHADMVAEAWRAIGVAHRTMRETAEAHAAFEKGLDAAAMDNNLAARGRLLVSRCILYFEAGDVESTLADLDEAEGLVNDEFRGVYLKQRASVLARTDPTADPIALMQEALGYLRQYGPRFDEANALRNIGLMAAYKGDRQLTEQAHADAISIFDELDLDEEAALTIHNLGWVRSLVGDFTGGQQLFQEVAHRLPPDDPRYCIAAVDHAQALLAVGLASEAAELAELSATRLEGLGQPIEAGEAHAVAAHAALQLGQFDKARTYARKSGELSNATDGRSQWAALARLLETRADEGLGVALATLETSAAATAESLELSGWLIAATDAWLVAAEYAARRGEIAAARSHYKKARVRLVGHAVEPQMQKQLVKARIAVGVRDSQAAMRHCREGFAVLEQFQSSLGAIDARAHIASLGQRLSELGLDLALQYQRPAQVLRWVDRTRSAALLTPPATASGTEHLGELIELNEVTSRLRTTSQRHEAGQLSRRRSELQQSINRRARSTTSDANQAPGLQLNHLRSRLGRRTLLQLFVNRDHIGAVVVDGHTTRLVADLASAAAVDDAAAALGAALGGLLRGRPSQREYHREAVVRAATTIDNLLLAPLDLGDSKTILIPPNSLNSLAWSLLPSMQGRAFVVSPGVRSWMLSTDTEAPTGPTIVAAGPDLNYSLAEATAVASQYPECTQFRTPDTSVTQLLQELDGASTAHLACHCLYMADSPLFTELVLDDGSVFVHDLHQLDRTPNLVVLSACDSAQNASPTGGELVGLAASLIAKGTSTLIACTLPLIDSSKTVGAFTELHRHLAKGAGPAEALVAIRDGLDHADFEDLLIDAAVGCYGSGW